MFNKQDYIKLKDQVIKRVEDKGIESISEFAALTGIPLLVQYEFILEEMPEHREYCEERIAELKEFLGL